MVDEALQPYGDLFDIFPSAFTLIDVYQSMSSRGIWSVQRPVNICPHQQILDALRKLLI